MPVKKIVAEELHLSVLPKATGKAFLFMSQMTMLQAGGWYLAGGTALALQVGHRSSVDLDFLPLRRHLTKWRLSENYSHPRPGKPRIVKKVL